MLSGDGGTGKSLLALQLAVARASATEWAGQVPDRGQTLFVSAEDDIPDPPQFAALMSPPTAPASDDA